MYRVIILKPISRLSRVYYVLAEFRYFFWLCRNKAMFENKIFYRINISVHLNANSDAQDNLVKLPLYDV